MKRNFFQKYQEIFTGLFLLALWLCFGYFFVLSFQKPLYQDEGVFLAIGKGMAEGRLPYSDFWDHKTPGIYFLWSALYPLFGTRVIFYQIFTWLCNFLSAILVFGLAEKLKQGSGKFAAIFFLCALVFFEGNYLTVGPFLGFLTILAVWLVLFYQQKRAFFAAGAVLGVAILFKQTAVLGLLPFLIYFLWQKKFRETVFFIIGWAAPIIVSIIYFWSRGVLAEFWQQAFVASFQNYPAEPLGTVFKLWVETFARVWWLWAGVLLAILSFNKLPAGKWLITLSILFPAFTFFVRHYPHYWLQVLPLLSVLAGLGFLFLYDYLSGKEKNLLLIMVYVLVVVSVWQNLLWFNWVTANLNRPKLAEQTEIAAKLKNYRGFQLLTENRYTGFHFLTDTRPLNKYLYLTEVNESENARQKTLDDFKNQENVVALWPKDQTYVYAKEIGQYLAENYRVIGEYPKLDLLIYIKN